MAASMKTYVGIAKALHKIGLGYDVGQDEVNGQVFTECVQAVASALWEDNPSFDFGKFYAVVWDDIPTDGSTGHPWRRK